MLNPSSLGMGRGARHKNIRMTSELARAKINLYLHVAAPDARGWHPLQSLVAFADTGDRLAPMKGALTMVKRDLGLDIARSVAERLMPGSSARFVPIGL